LNAEESDPRVTYQAAWIGDGTKREMPDGVGNIWFSSSARRTATIKKLNYTETYFNSGQNLVYSDRILRLDQFAATVGKDDIDVVKIDTDSFDYFVLEGASQLLTEGSVLLVECECQFHDLIGSKWPVFSDIGRLMRRAGYRLVDLDPWHYTRAELPGRFKYDIAAQNETGQVLFCDALYMLDPSIDISARERLGDNPTKFWKLAMLLNVFGYSDLAVATLLTMRDIRSLFPGLIIEDAIDMMVPPNPFGATTYKDYIAAFEGNPDQFFATNWRKREVEASRPKERRGRGHLDALLKKFRTFMF
jgi:hypothetical protein